MISIAARWLGRARAVIVAPHCLLCHDATPDDAGLCSPCRAELPWIGSACRYCALPLVEQARSDTCAACRRGPAFDGAAAACHYEAAIAWLITGLKFRHRRAHAAVLAELLAAHIRAAADEIPDLLVPVPLHATSLRKRGFNQAERIATHLAARLDTVVARKAVVRRRATARQSELGRAERAANVRGAFVCHQDLTGRHVAVVDDVMTTTRTAAAVAASLRAAGATRVDAYSVARA